MHKTEQCRSLTLIGNEWALDDSKSSTSILQARDCTTFSPRSGAHSAIKTKVPDWCSRHFPANHTLLQLVATIAALNGYQLIFLGPKTPLQDIEGCALQSQAKAVCISISATANLVRAREMILELRQMMPENINIVLGGQGAPSDIENVIQIDSLNDFASWSLANI